MNMLKHRHPVVPDVRLIACLDLGRDRPLSPSGIRALPDREDAVAICRHYEAEGATLIYLDVDEGWEHEQSFLPVIERVARAVSVPVAVMVRSGTVRGCEDVARVLSAGASCYAINTSAVERPILVDEIIARCGKQSLLGVVSARGNGAGRWEAMIQGGTRATGMDAVAWAAELVQRGVFALVVNSCDMEGAHRGYDLPLIGAVADAVTVPVVASGGAGTVAHLLDAMTLGGAGGVLGNSLFHAARCSVGEARRALEGVWS